MAIFNFTAIKKNGEQYTSRRESTDKFSLYREMREQGETVIHADMVKEITSSGNLLGGLLGAFLRIKTHEKISFAKNLSSMLSAGLALTRALSVLERQTKNKRLSKMLSSLSDSVSKGKTFSQALGVHPGVFSTLFVSMVHAGEESGSLPDALNIVGTQMDNAYKLEKKIRGAMLYPAVILFAMVLVAILMLIFVVPSLTTTFTELKIELPASTRALIWASDFINNHLAVSILSIIGLIVFVYLSAKTRAGGRVIDWLVLRIPIIGNLVKQTNAARTTRTLSSLLKSGVSIAESLKITGDVLQNTYYKDVLREAEKNVEKGTTISSVFMAHSDLYPVFVSEMMSVGEETGSVASMLMNVAVYYEEEVEQKTKDMSTIIEPFLMIVIGMGVGFFAISMLSPMYSLADAM